ncbi:MAG: hypothetical protein ACRC62_17895 [Microcoleus sp.]
MRTSVRQIYYKNSSIVPNREMQAIGALMRKLVHWAFGIGKSQKPFDPNYAIATSGLILTLSTGY